jgi:hypothetical protein
MKTAIRINWLSATALLLALPAAYFILINVLNEMGVAGPYNISQPLLENLGIKQSLGWNINLLIALGPAIALTISLFQILKIKFHFSKEQIDFNAQIKLKWLPLLVAALSAGLLAILFIYLFAENYNC